MSILQKGPTTPGLPLDVSATPGHGVPTVFDADRLYVLEVIVRDSAAIV